MGSALLLALVVGAGTIPTPKKVSHFPDVTYWAGSGPHREANMLSDVIVKPGEELRSAGPGPQQLAARWAAGHLSGSERVVTLLAGATFHHPALLPCYGEAVRSSELRERQAAAVGFAWLVGARPPALATLPRTPEAWSAFADGVDRIIVASRVRSLVGLWVDSYARTVHRLRPSHRGGIWAPADDCIEAIRQIAQPDDLDELISLWPLLDSDQHRISLLRTIEIVTVQRLVVRETMPRRALGQLLYGDALRRVDQLVGGACASVNGEEALRDGLRRLGVLPPGGTVPAGTWLAVLEFPYPPMWPLAAERLVELGARPVTPNRHSPSESLEDSQVRKLRSSFPITSSARERSRGPERLR